MRLQYCDCVSSKTTIVSDGRPLAAVLPGKQIGPPHRPVGTWHTDSSPDPPHRRIGERIAVVERLRADRPPRVVLNVPVAQSAARSPLGKHTVRVTSLGGVCALTRVRHAGWHVADAVGDSANSSRRRIVKIVLTVAITAGAIASLSGMGLISCSGPSQPAPIRPLTEAEVTRLAGMRAENHRAGQVGLRGTIGPVNARIQVNGWIDWRRSLMYVALHGPTADSAALLQATPTVLAVRAGAAAQSGSPSATPTPGPESGVLASASPTGDQVPTVGPGQTGAAQPSAGTPATIDQPPLLPPADGWRVRPVSVGTPGSTPLDSFVSFMFLLARPTADDQALLAPLRNQWIRTDTVQGTSVDVLLGPALPLSGPTPTATPPAPTGPPVAPTTPAAGGTGGGTGVSDIRTGQPSATGSTQPTSPERSGAPTQSPAALDPKSLDSHGGGVGYWLDAQGRLHRLEVMLASGQPAVIDLLRSEQAEFRTIDAFGGRPIAPRPVTDREAALLARTRVQNLAARGGHLTLTLPVRPDALRRAEGWLDWRNGRVYLSVRDPHDVANDRLIFADRNTVASHRVEGPAPALPPTTPPRGGWERTAWTAITNPAERTDLDLLLFELVSLAAGRPDDVDAIRSAARWLRVDLLHDVPVGVFELPGPAEQQSSAPGLARMRYWIDNNGVLRRLELRTGTGGLAQLDVDPARQPSAPLPTAVR